MKLWTIPAFGIGKLETREAPIPKAERGQVVMKVHACSLNYRDLMTVKGAYNPKLRLPRVPLSDGAGVIHAVGEGVTRVQLGDRVAGIFMQNWLDGPPAPEKYKGALGGDIDGMAAQYVALPESGVVRLPAYLSFVQAATLPCAAVTAWSALHKAGAITSGSTVLIQGTGGVSIAALQLAKALGARVLGTSGSDEKLARARTLGLDAGVNYHTTPDWAAWALEQTDGEGVDLVVEVGGSGTFGQSLQAARVGGSVAQIGVLAQGDDPVPIRSILHKQLHVQGIYVGSRTDFEALNRALAATRIEPVVDREFGLNELPEALRVMESAAHFGKLVLHMQQQE